MAISNENQQTQTLDAIVDLVGANGYRAATPAAIAKAAGISEVEFRREFPTRAAWVEAAYGRLYERRIAQFRKAARSLPAGNRNPKATLKAVMSLFLDGEEPDPLFAATFDFFFFSRNDARLLRRVMSIRARATRQIEAITPSLFPAGTGKQARDIFMTHAVSIGSTAVSNGLAGFDVRVTDYPIMLSLIGGE